MNPPWKKFGDWTLRTGKERREAKEEREWAARSGEVTTRNIQDEPQIISMTVQEYLDWFDTLGPDDIKRHFQSEPPQFTDTQMRDLAESLGQALLDKQTLAKTREEEENE